MNDSKGKRLTQLERARADNLTAQMESVIKKENCDVEYLLSEIAQGRIVIPANLNGHFRKREPRLAGIGRGLSTKVNANIGTSTECDEIENELGKLRAAEEAGA